MNKGTYSLLGFILLALGVLALVLNLVGVQLAFLTWIDNFGQLAGFVIRLIIYNCRYCNDCINSFWRASS